MASMKISEGYEAKPIDYKLEEKPDGWHITVWEKGGNGWGVGTAFPSEDRALKAARAIIDFAYYKPPLEFSDSGKRTRKGTGVSDNPFVKKSEAENQAVAEPDESESAVSPLG